MELQTFIQLSAATQLLEENELAILETTVALRLTDGFLVGFEQRLSQVTDDKEVAYCEALRQGYHHRSQVQAELVRLKKNNAVLHQQVERFQAEGGAR